MKLELVFRSHDDVFTNWTEVFGRLEEAVHLHDVSVVAAQFVE